MPPSLDLRWIGKRPTKSRWIRFHSYGALAKRLGMETVKRAAERVYPKQGRLM